MKSDILLSLESGSVGVEDSKNNSLSLKVMTSYFFLPLNKTEVKLFGILAMESSSGASRTCTGSTCGSMPNYLKQHSFENHI